MTPLYEVQDRCSDGYILKVNNAYSKRSSQKEAVHLPQVHLALFLHAVTETVYSQYGDKSNSWPNAEHYSPTQDICPEYRRLFHHISLSRVVLP